MNNQDSQPKKGVNGYFAIVITQCVCVIIILLTVICVKFFFKGTYNQLKSFYDSQICIDTDIDEVLSQTEDEQI